MVWEFNYLGEDNKIKFNNKMENNEPPLPFLRISFSTLVRNKKKNTPRKQTDVRSHLDHSIRTIHDIIRRKNITQNQKPIQF